ncbi:hypothetical protein JJB49_04900 [Clostridium perfringens]|uniref:rolling circle replication-associated protein n=1 Tax=Clostridium perfringens TaxID=1502 RepID=UPI001ABA1CB1|nr:hypothetical protein [Clostridium perfringens]MBO3393930.1 hypothetical protein [Clostridium perfringens]MBO3400005.1 hypothetical protein [Clostridium perfringens]MDM1010752.1 hypothetical protein [Clostridium perfringens]
MIYREKKIYSGNMLEIEIYPITLQERKQKRKKKEKESLPKQRNLNEKNAKKHLARLINANFTDKDLTVTLSYDNEHRPKSEEEASKDVRNFIRRIKRYLKKNKMPDLKYIAVVEYAENIKIHHHIVLSGDIDREKLEELWGKGWANSHRLKANEFGYEELAKYIAKDPKGRKRWSQSRKLKTPVVRVNDFKYSRRKIREMKTSQGERAYFEKMFKGYTYRDFKYIENEINACTYITIKMQKINGRN